MTVKYMCDRCGASIADSRNRYKLKMQLYAAYDGMELSAEELRSNRDLKHEIEQLIKEMESMDERDLTDQVYADFEYDLCPACRNEVYEQLRGRMLI